MAAVHVALYVVIASCGMLISAAVYERFPAYRNLLLVEDSLVESLTAAVFLAGSLLASALCVRGGRSRRALMLVAALGLVGFMDEISYGARFFGITMPRIRGIVFDGVHDVVFLVFASRTLRRVVASYPALASLTVAAGGFGLTPLAIRLGRTGVQARVWRPPYIFLLFFAVQVAIALLIDLETVKHMVLFVLEEVLELNAALALVFFSLSLWREERDGVRRRGPLAVAGAAAFGSGAPLGQGAMLLEAGEAEPPSG